jgi:hypothetical protein
MSEIKTEAPQATPKRRSSGIRVAAQPSSPTSTDTSAQPLVGPPAVGAQPPPVLGEAGAGDSAGGPPPEAHARTPGEDGVPVDASMGAPASEALPITPDASVVDRNAAIQAPGNPNFATGLADAPGTGSTADEQAGSPRVGEPMPPRKVRGLRPGETEEERRVRLIDEAAKVTKNRKRRLKKFLSAKATAELDEAKLRLKAYMNKRSAKHPYRSFEVLESIADKAWDNRIEPKELLKVIDQMTKE